MDAAENAPEPNYLVRLQDHPMPKTKKDIKKFLCVCGWIRVYVLRFAEFATPLTNLLKKR